MPSCLSGSVFAVQFLTLINSNSISIQMVGDPGDGAGEAFFEFDFGGPAEVVTGFGVVGEEAQDFGVLGAEAGGILDDGEVGFVEDL